MRFRSLAASFLLGTLTALVGCNQIVSKHEQPDSVSFQKLTSFQALKVEILDAKCARCHNGSTTEGGVDFTSYETMLANPSLVTPGNLESSGVYAAVADGSMPLGGPRLSAEEVQAIGDWILAGAPQGDFDSSGSPTPQPVPQPPNQPPSPPPTLPPQPAPPSPAPVASYSVIQAQIFDRSCVRCHSGSRPSGNVDLTNYSLLMANTRPKVVEPGLPKKSLVYTEITSGSMPPRGAKVDPALTAILKTWIEQGAKND